MRGNYDHVRCPTCGLPWTEHHAPMADFAWACTVQFHLSRPAAPPTDPEPAAVAPAPFSLNGHVIAAEASP